MIYILMLICISLDFITSYFIPNYFNQLNYFFPMLTLTYLVYLYKKIPKKKYYKIAFIMGFIYDILFSYLFLFNTLIFILFAKILTKIDKYIRFNIFISLIILIIFIFIYDFILFILTYISLNNLLTLNDLFYKFIHSISLNIIFYLLLTIIINKRIISKQ